ncbi:MAG: tRNA (pseudouridine(54)-N(1))-methyltransferase TrmY [Halobacteriaceae archaeon]
MRQFVVVGHEAPTTADFELDDLASGAGRLDLLCRAAGAALFLSHGIREDVTVHLVLRDELTVRLEGATLRNARPDERTLAGLVRAALAERAEVVGHVPVDVSPGVTISGRDLAATVERVAADGPVVQLHEDGESVVDADLPEDVGFVLSDHREFTAAEADLLADAADRRVSLGPRAIHADHAIAVAHNNLDTGGYTRY